MTWWWNSQKKTTTTNPDRYQRTSLVTWRKPCPACIMRHCCIIQACHIPRETFFFCFTLLGELGKPTHSILIIILIQERQGKNVMFPGTRNGTHSNNRRPCKVSVNVSNLPTHRESQSLILFSQVDVSRSNVASQVASNCDKCFVVLLKCSMQSNWFHQTIVVQACNLPSGSDVNPFSLWIAFLMW